ncbi:translation machinery-associated protein 16-like [Dendronephthya gigantea]|uniref:translation machinery-associated protein 16-like n=1 Tax=Dendronephthya gigantea TaxID=151771 RepID=UPI00106A8231|nr:translation machinery-associated protein 16-like [Dendronephthya gigantea]
MTTNKFLTLNYQNFILKNNLLKMPKEPKVKVSEKVIHPRSRKAAQMIRNAHRKDKVDKRKSERAIVLQSLADKVQWFKDHVKPEAKYCSIQEVHDLINMYFMRFDKELEQLRLGDNIKGRQLQGGAKFSRENNIKAVLSRERQVYDSSGFEIPDLTSRGNMKLLRAWNGNLEYLPKIKLKRFCSSEISALEEPAVEGTKIEEHPQ